MPDLIPPEELRDYPQDCPRLIASGGVTVATCRTCRWADSDPGGWLAAQRCAREHVSTHPGHVTMAMQQATAVYADRGERIT